MFESQRKGDLDGEEVQHLTSVSSVVAENRKAQKKMVRI